MLKVSNKQIYIDALNRLGVKPDDTVYCHSDMTPFLLGKDKSREVIEDWELAIEESLPAETATIVLPTFCWDFYKGKRYDPSESRCNTGCLNEHLRHQPAYARTAHPAFSHIVRGKRAEAFLDTGMDAFGPDSVFGVLNGINSKILFVGVPFWKCCTYVHFIEQLWAVPYRTMRYFLENVYIAGRPIQATCLHFAKPLDGTIEADFMPLENLLRQEGALRETEVDGGKVAVVDAAEVFRCARKMLDGDIEALIKRRAK